MTHRNPFQTIKSAISNEQNKHDLRKAWKTFFSDMGMDTRLEHNEVRLFSDIMDEIHVSRNRKINIRVFLEELWNAILKHPRIMKRFLNKVILKEDFPKSIHRFTHLHKIIWIVIEFLRYRIFGPPISIFSKQLQRYHQKLMRSFYDTNQEQVIESATHPQRSIQQEQRWYDIVSPQEYNIHVLDELFQHVMDNIRDKQKIKQFKKTAVEMGLWNDQHVKKLRKNIVTNYLADVINSNDIVDGTNIKRINEIVNMYGMKKEFRMNIQMLAEKYLVQQLKRVKNKDGAEMLRRRLPYSFYEDQYN